MTKHTLQKSDLLQFTGSECIYRHPLNKRVAYTEGAQFVAEKGGAYWLLDIIATNQVLPAFKVQPFQVWTLVVDLDTATARITCDDGNDKVFFSHQIDYTDFPLEEIKLYCEDGVILLPTEH